MSVAIAISMVISLTTTPMMCAHLLKEHESHGWMYRTSERGFNWIVGLYGRHAGGVLRHPAITLGCWPPPSALNVYLFIHVPKGFFPQQDNGRMNGTIIADQDTSFQAMEGNLLRMVKIVRRSGGGYRDRIHRRQRRLRKHHQQARMHIQLKPLAERKVSVYDDVIERLRPKLSVIRGATLYLQAARTCAWAGATAPRSINSPCAATMCRT
jgi:multidrug efflux pump